MFANVYDLYVIVIPKGEDFIPIKKTSDPFPLTGLNSPASSITVIESNKKPLTQ